MRPIRTVSVLIPTYQGMEFLDRLMGGLAEQDLELEWGVYAIDSSSSDGTWEALETGIVEAEERGPAWEHLIGIDGVGEVIVRSRSKASSDRGESWYRTQKPLLPKAPRPS